MDDFPFRYKLDADKAANASCRDRVLEMLTAQLENILDVLLPTQGGKGVKVDGFKLLRDDQAPYPLFGRKSPVENPGAALPQSCHSEGARPGGRPKNPLPIRIAHSETPTSQEQTLRPSAEGLRVTSGNATRPGCPYQDAQNAALYEPRIELIKRQLESLLSVIELEREGQVIKPDGFRLRDLTDWLIPSSGDPAEVFEYGGSRCNCDCVFCYIKGNPPTLSLTDRSRPREDELREMMTRLRYFAPQTGQALFPTLGSPREVLLHPQIIAVLRGLREKTLKPFRISTNGATLTPSTVAELAGLKPLFLYVSLNSASPSRRRKLMRDNHPQTAIGSFSLLKEHEIPYAAVITPWPAGSLRRMLQDLASSVAYADRHDAQLVQINLPGHSEHFSSQPLFDLNEVWGAIVSRVRDLRHLHACPIVVMPSMYEENIFEERKNLPRAIGVVKNSPAARGGLQPGDIVTRINSLTVRNRPQARDLLSLVHQSGAPTVAVTVYRGSQLVELSLNPRSFGYPYCPDTDRHLGAVFLGAGFRESCVERLREVIVSRGAKRVLLLSSRLVRPTLEQGLREASLLPPGVHLEIEVPRNRFFGGNIFMGDLLVVQDFIDHINDYVSQAAQKPDLVVVPSSPFSLGPWQRDLTGRPYLDIERAVGIPVALVDCSPILE